MKTIILHAKTMKPYSHGGLKLQVVDDVIKGIQHEYLLTAKGTLIGLEYCVAEYQIPFDSFVAEYIKTNHPELKPELV